MRKGKGRKGKARARVDQHQDQDQDSLDHYRDFCKHKHNISNVVQVQVQEREAEPLGVGWTGLDREPGAWSVTPT